jgi:hypothetical protein
MPHLLMSGKNLVKNRLCFLTFFFCELVEQAGLSDAHVSDYDVLEDVGVVVRSGRHGRD